MNNSLHGDLPRFAMWLGLVVLTAGCQPESPSRSSAVRISTAPLPSNRAPTADEAVASDASAARLHDIVGAILNYYVHNGNRLPDTLDDIKPFADFGTELNLISPSSGLPYVYSSAGLLADVGGVEKRLIVWDPKPNSQGLRWCILMPHMQPGVAIVPEVVPIQENVFQAFAPAIQ